MGMRKEITFSIIAPILVFNDEMVEMTESMIKDISLVKSERTEFIIIDNNSTKGSDIMEKGADVYVRLDKNRGWGGGLNVGMSLARGKYFIFVNNDIMVKPGEPTWLEKIENRFVSCPKTGTISVNGHGGFSAALFAIRREIYELIGEFDEENFPLGHAQDCDFLYRLMKEGWDDHVIIVDGYWHHGRRTYLQKEFQDKYYQHPNFSRSDFEKKWGFKEAEWENRGHKDWRARIESDPTLDRFNELKNG